jgi:hypothetical protein
MNLAGKLLDLWQKMRRRRRVARVVWVGSMSEVPRRLGGDLYIVAGIKPKWAVLECPCRCGDRIDVNLMQSRRPCWAVTMTGKEITLNPSLWMPTEKCGSHFLIRKNQIAWVE